jgi:hypothetical protein
MGFNQPKRGRKGDLSTNRNGDEWLLVWSFSGNVGDEDG